MDYMNIVRWDNEYMKNYDKVIKELKEKFKIKENYNKVLNQLKNLNWIKVNPEKNYNQKINTFFDETDDILSTKIVKYKNIIKKLEFKKTYNTNIKQKALDKSLLVKTCPVCYDDNFESYAITRCGHTFCTNCIKNVYLPNSNVLCVEEFYSLKMYPFLIKANIILYINTNLISIL